MALVSVAVWLVDGLVAWLRGLGLLEWWVVAAGWGRLEASEIGRWPVQ